jgi:hypothetical protein
MRMDEREGGDMGGIQASSGTADDAVTDVDLGCVELPTGVAVELMRRATARGMALVLVGTRTDRHVLVVAPGVGELLRARAGALLERAGARIASVAECLGQGVTAGEPPVRAAGPDVVPVLAGACASVAEPRRSWAGVNQVSGNPRTDGADGRDRNRSSAPSSKSARPSR